MVVSLPAHDPGPHRGRNPVDRPRPGRLRTLRQAHTPDRVHLRPPRRVAAGAPLRPPRPIGVHPRRPGLGRSARAPPGRRAPRPLRPCGGGQHLPAHRRPAPRTRRSSTGSASPRRSRSSRPGLIVDTGCTTDLDPDGRGRLRRPLPRPALRRGGPPVPDPGPDHARGPGVGGQPFVVGGPAPLRPALPHRLQRPGPDNRRWFRAVPAGGPRGPGPSHTDYRGCRPLPPGGPGPDLAAVVAEFVHST